MPYTLLMLLVAVSLLMATTPKLLNIFPVQGFVLQFYAAIAVLCVTFYSVVVEHDIVAFCIAFCIAFYYATNKDSVSFPGAYKPAVFGLNKDGTCPKTNTIQQGCANYFGRFEVRGSTNTDFNKEAQYFIAIHPHGPTAFSRMHFVSGVRGLFARPCRPRITKILINASP